MNNHITTNTTTSRRRLIALAAILAVGAGASVAGLPAADAEAQEYRTTFYGNVTKQPDYVISDTDYHYWQHRLFVDVFNKGGPAKSGSWLSVRDDYSSRIMDWVWVPALDSNEVFRAEVAPQGRKFCADAWENYVEESDEDNNCGWDYGGGTGGPDW